MNERMELVVKGDVQAVGYRTEVQKAAVKFNIVGNVQNIEDGTVKVVCEGSKDDLERFIRAIRIRRGRIYVDGILRTPGHATGGFNRFRIERGPLSRDALEIMERLDTGMIMTKEGFGEISRGQRKMHRDLSGGQRSMHHGLLNGQERMHSDLSLGQQKTIKAIKSMDSNMGKRFDHLDSKYGEFGNTLKGMARDVKGTRKATDRMGKDIKATRTEMTGMARDVKGTRKGMDRMGNDINAIRNEATRGRKIPSTS
jgi:acylphosphatase